MTIILTKEDYNFIDWYCDKFNIPEGKGFKIQFSRLINEYKKREIGQN